MKLKVWGPLLFATMLFVIAGAIKIIAFENFNVWLELAPELALWATGVLFSLAISEYSQFGGKQVSTIVRKPTGSGVEIDFGIQFPNNLEFGLKYQYLFVYGMMVWILTILLSGQASAFNSTPNHSPLNVYFLNAVSLLLSGTSIGAAVRALFEVS